MHEVANEINVLLFCVQGVAYYLMCLFKKEEFHESNASNKSLRGCGDTVWNLAFGNRINSWI